MFFWKKPPQLYLLLLIYLITKIVIYRCCFVISHLLHLYTNHIILLTMKDRILRIIEEKNLTPSRFADEVGLNRPAVSHILNGRNNPGLEALQRILNRFPDISGTWLITGEGSMYQTNPANRENNPTLFDESPEFSTISTENDKYAKEIAVKSPDFNGQNTEYQSLIPIKSKSVKVKKIAIFFSDNTYEEFIPAEKE